MGEQRKGRTGVLIHPKGGTASAVMGDMKILWSIDAFESSEKGLSQVTYGLKTLSTIPKAELQPTYVFYPSDLDISASLSRNWMQSLLPKVEAKLKARVRRHLAIGARKPQVLLEPKPSMTAAARTLMRQAKSAGSDLVVLATHARKGVKKWMLGSFAEKALFQAQVPILLLGPHQKPLRKLERIVFATDFSPQSQKAFRKVLSLAAAAQAELVIFHAQTAAVEPLLQSGIFLLGGGWLGTQEFLTEDEGRKRRHAERWRALALRRGIACRAILRKAKRSVSEEVRSIAEKEKADLIALQAQSGPVAATLLGSVTRELVEDSSLPLWLNRG